VLVPVLQGPLVSTGVVVVVECGDIEGRVGLVGDLGVGIFNTGMVHVAVITVQHFARVEVIFK
jgi:hypothetical protein